MLYEISPDANGKWNMRLYNTGAGSVEHERKTVGYKVKVAPKNFVDIDPVHLNSDEFLRFVADLKVGGRKFT